MNDPKLKLAMARLLPGEIFIRPAFYGDPTVCGTEPLRHEQVEWAVSRERIYETEWLHVMHLVEQENLEKIGYYNQLTQVVKDSLNLGRCTEADIRAVVAGATFNQRATAMCKVKGVTP